MVLFSFQEKEALLVGIRLQTQQHLQCVVARHSGRQEKMRKAYQDVGGKHQRMDPVVC